MKDEDLQTPSRAMLFGLLILLGMFILIFVGAFIFLISLFL